MPSIYGNNLKVSIFGESHSQAIGTVIDGLPPGEKIDLDTIQSFLDRRAPGRNRFSTQRRETDTPSIVSGLHNGCTIGSPLCAVIANTDTHSSDYNNILSTPRPSHADYPAFVRSGIIEPGGGHYSGRLTAPLCFAGAVCMQLLERHGITIGAHIYSIENINDDCFDPVGISSETISDLKDKIFPVLNDSKGSQMQKAIEQAASERDSVGGIIECCILGMNPGIGGPIFDGLENRIASAIFGIPAVKGIEFGLGFASAGIRGSVCNDPYYIDNRSIKTRTNNNGGILGGLSTGMPIIFRAAIKPTPSIGIEQQSVDLASMSDTVLTVKGRHDPCIVPRAVPCVEAASAIAVLDAILGMARL